MSKTEMLRQSAAASNEKRLAHLTHQIEAVRQAKAQSVEELAVRLEPLAQAMAALTDETYTTLQRIDQRTQEQAQAFSEQLQTEMLAFRQSMARARKAAADWEQAAQTGQRRLLRQMIAIGLWSSIVTAVLVSGLWRWVAPPIQTSVTLDTQAVANLLQPPLTAACRGSGGS